MVHPDSETFPRRIARPSRHQVAATGVIRKQSHLGRVPIVPSLTLGTGFAGFEQIEGTALVGEDDGGGLGPDEGLGMWWSR